jgi:hypothetical protein
MVKRASRRRDLTDAWHALVPLIPAPWSAEELVHRVALSRQRPIHLLPYPLSTGDPTGYWVSIPAADFIIVPDSASDARRDAIIGHELAHIVLGHDPQPTNQLDGLAALAPNSSPDLVARFLPRHGYQADIEQEAETLATRLIAYIETRSHEPGRSATEHDRLTDRLR